MDLPGVPPLVLQTLFCGEDCTAKGKPLAPDGPAGHHRRHALALDWEQNLPLRVARAPDPRAYPFRALRALFDLWTDALWMRSKPTSKRNDIEGRADHDQRPALSQLRVTWNFAMPVGSRPCS